MVDVQDGSLPSRLPSPFPLSGGSDVAAWITAHQDELERYAGDLTAVAKSLKITQAEGRALDELGEGFGVLGRRRGRDDGPYRSYLLSLLGAFDGRGTVPGVETAIAAGVLADTDAISLIEDTDALEYEVVLRDWQPHRTSTVHDLADLADPSVVERRDPLHYVVDTAATAVSVGDSRRAVMAASPPATPALAPGGVEHRVAAVGLSAPELDALSTRGWRLSIRDAPAAVVALHTADARIATMLASGTTAVAPTAAQTITRPMTRLAAARMAVAGQATDHQPMQHSPPAETTITTADRAPKTLATHGLSASELGSLSTTSMQPLA